MKRGSGSVSRGLPLGEGPRLLGRMTLAPLPKGGRGKLTHYLKRHPPHPPPPRGLPPARRVAPLLLAPLPPVPPLPDLDVVVLLFEGGGEDVGAVVAAGGGGGG